VHTYELTPNSAAAAGKVWRRRQPNFGWRTTLKTDGGAAEGSM